MDVDPEEQSRRETEALLQEAKLLLSDGMEDDGVAQLAAYGEDDFSDGDGVEEEEEEEEVMANEEDDVMKARQFHQPAAQQPEPDAIAPQHNSDLTPVLVSESNALMSQPATAALEGDQPLAKQEKQVSFRNTNSSRSSVAPPSSVSRPPPGTRVVTPMSNVKPPERRPPPPSRQSTPQQQQQQPTTSRARTTTTSTTPTPPPSRPSRQAPVAAPRAASSSSSSSSSRHARLVGSSSSGAPRSPTASTRASSPPRAQSPPAPLPRKAPVFRQKHRPTPRELSRRTLSPVKCPPQLRIELPSADKEQRAWLLLNMFRHGDDTRQYEAFIPRISPNAKAVGASTSTASLPSRPTSSGSASTAVHRVDEATSTVSVAAAATGPPEHHPQDSDAISETFERLARRYGHGRRLRPSRDSTTNAALRSRERNWVATRPYDSSAASLRLDPRPVLQDRHEPRGAAPYLRHAARRPIAAARARARAPCLP
ncbi:hypothetical protein PINS_up021246 [Pythium insidiosum]|nr:hypothetical protein PINS_up021246 [Pythium insidiosum]